MHDGEWHDVAVGSDLDRGAIHADDRHDVVVWRTASGVACVMESRCPHQWSHLAAEGVVDGEEIVCAAHFWRFDTSGQGSKLNVNGRRDAKSDIETFRCRDRGGVIEAWFPADRLDR